MKPKDRKRRSKLDKHLKNLKKKKDPKKCFLFSKEQFEYAFQYYLKEQYDNR